MVVKLGYATHAVGDGTVQFIKAGPQARVYGKMHTLMTTYFSETPSRALDSGSKIPSFLHEPDDEVLGYQLMIEINKYAATKIPEILVKGVFIDRSDDSADSGIVNVLVVYVFENKTVEERFSVNTNNLGVT